MDPSTLRSRTIRECILRLLHNTFAANPDVGVLAAHIFEGFSTGQVRFTAEEIGAELADLIADNLINVENAPGVAAMPEKLYRITSRGRDFVKSHFPWSAVDEFSGKEKI